jgi:hypothetical protein
VRCDVCSAHASAPAKKGFSRHECRKESANLVSQLYHPWITIGLHVHIEVTIHERCGDGNIRQFFLDLPELVDEDGLSSVCAGCHVFPQDRNQIF